MVIQKSRHDAIYVAALMSSREAYSLSTEPAARRRVRNLPHVRQTAARVGIDIGAQQIYDVTFRMALFNDRAEVG